MTPGRRIVCIIVVSRRRGKCNAIRVQNGPSVLRILELIAGSVVHAIANAHHRLDVCGKGRFAGCENDVSVVDDPLHHGGIIRTEAVWARIGQVLRIGNNGDGEIGARFYRWRGGRRVCEARCRCACQTAQDSRPEPAPGNFLQKAFRREPAVFDHVLQFSH